MVRGRTEEAAACLTTFFRFFVFWLTHSFICSACLFLEQHFLVGLTDWHHHDAKSILRWNTVIVLIHLHFLEKRTEGRKSLWQMDRWGLQNMIMNLGQFLLPGLKKWLKFSFKKENKHFHSFWSSADWQSQSTSLLLLHIHVLTTLYQH